MVKVPRADNKKAFEGLPQKLFLIGVDNLDGFQTLCWYAINTLHLQKCLFYIYYFCPFLDSLLG